MKKKKNKIDGDFTAVDQIEAYLKDNQSDHYNFEEERDYTVSSGSLKLDIEMGGGIKPGVIRASGVTEGGKTSCALAFAKNFQKIDNSMVVYVKSEGRLSDNMLERSGVDTSSEKLFIYKCNIFESVINLFRQLVHDNINDTRYMFIVDSMDALIPRGDLEKSSDEAVKVAGGSLLTSDFLKRMALSFASKGHICYMISQVRSTIKINPYEKGDPQVTNASGGNAALHYSDWILEFQPRYNKDIISTQANGKGEHLGHWCKIIFRKTANEKTGIEVKYPIRYGRTNGQSIWAEYEVVEMLQMFDMAQAKGAWVTVSDEIIEEVKEKLDLDFKKQHQGVDNLRKYFEENTEIGKYLFKKFRNVLKKS
jgi:RecA/RadA recombinase|tara:strand:+ start:1251 stop:2348 length:1098 start_codon:yes stop_codon:yes gene_type:complete